MGIMPLSFALLTWRECVVGMKPVESAQLEIRRTWDVRPKNIPNSPINAIQDKMQRMGGGVNSETLGFVRWRMSNTTLFNKPCRLLRAEGYDQKAHVLRVEEVWTTPEGDILRQRDERTDEGGKEVAESVFWPDRIELTRIDEKKRSTFAEVNPAGGMEEVQRRFKPIQGDRKTFLHFDGITGGFQRVEVQRAGRFQGQWGGEKYDGAAYRFTVNGVATTLMLTQEEEVVQVDFDKETSLVLSGPTKSRRKPGFDGLARQISTSRFASLNRKSKIGNPKSV